MTSNPKPWGIRMPWAPFTGERAVSGSTGVYEISDAEGHSLYIGAAGARDLFGLKGCIGAHASDPEATQYRYEVTSAYLSRWMELLGRYQQEHGRPPPLNRSEETPSLPRFSPATNAAE